MSKTYSNSTIYRSLLYSIVWIKDKATWFIRWLLSFPYEDSPDDGGQNVYKMHFGLWGAYRKHLKCGLHRLPEEGQADKWELISRPSSTNLIPLHL